ncbi:MAG: ParA family protein [Chloroflexi bacterium]|nr:ParA family protein [Chloroflexota bacterium]MBU1746170.1 ParA family protein [Chloroflexota bacterium]
MTRIIAIANQKGGVGKTTTTYVLGHALAERGRTVLLVDLDPQSSLTIACGREKEGMAANLYHVLGGQEPGTHALRDIVVKVNPGIYLAPADIALSLSESGLMLRMRREYVLQEALAGATPDYVLIDCLPSLGILTVNALVAASEVLIPTQCEYLALRGLAMIYQTINRMRPANPNLQVLGILPTFFDPRLIHSREILEAMRARGLPVLPVVIGRSVRFAESALAHESILTYDPSNPGTQAYQALAEVIDG